MMLQLLLLSATLGLVMPHIQLGPAVERYQAMALQQPAATILFVLHYDHCFDSLWCGSAAGRGGRARSAWHAEFYRRSTVGFRLDAAHLAFLLELVLAGALTHLLASSCFSCH